MVLGYWLMGFRISPRMCTLTMLYDTYTLFNRKERRVETVQTKKNKIPRIRLHRFHELLILGIEYYRSNTVRGELRLYFGPIDFRWWCEKQMTKGKHHCSIGYWSCHISNILYFGKISTPETLLLLGI